MGSQLHLLSWEGSGREMVRAQAGGRVTAAWLYVNTRKEDTGALGLPLCVQDLAQAWYMVGT